MIALDVAALDPSPDEARGWLAEELSRSEYRESRSLLQQLLDWIGDRLADLQDTQGSGGVSLPPIVITLVVVLLVVGVGVVLARLRVDARAPRTGTGTLLGDSVRTAAQLRAEAAAAYDQRRWDDAVVAWTRAVARDAEERTLLPDAPSLTAHEVGAALTPAFPAHGAPIARLMDLFDAVVYGDRPAEAEDAALARDTDQALHAARPTLRTSTRDVAVPAAPAPRSATDSSNSSNSSNSSGSSDSVWMTGAGR